MAETPSEQKPAGSPKPVSTWWRTFRLAGLTFMFLLFLVAVLLPVVAFVILEDEITSPTMTYDFFGAELLVSTIALIVGLVFFGLGGFGLAKSIEMIVKAIKKVRFKLTWKPITAALALTGIVVAAIFYYSPFWYLSIGINPTFGPHVAIHGRPNAMQVSWRTAIPAQTIVNWGDDPSSLNRTAVGGEFYWQDGTEATYHHCVVLDSLVPGQKYYYNVPSLGFGAHAFTAPPTLSSGGKVTFTILGDTQGAFNVQRRNIANMLALKGIDGINFTFICGDNVNDDDDMAEWAMLFHESSYGRIIPQVPWNAASGNHETGSHADDWPIRKNFKTFHQNVYITENSTVPAGAQDIGVYYSFNYSNVHLTVLDTHQLAGTNNLTAAQLAFLESDLASVNDTTMWKFVTFHVPLYSTSVRGGSKAEEDLAHQLEPILYKYRVDAVFYGHDHVYEAFHVNASSPHDGMLAFTCAGGGGSIKDVQNPDKHTNPLHAWESNINIVSNYTDGRFDDIYGHEWQLYGEATHHYMVIDVEGDVATFSAYRTSDNSLIKAYTVNR